MSLVDQIEAMIESGLSVKDALKAARAIENAEKPRRNRAPTVSERDQVLAALQGVLSPDRAAAVVAHRTKIKAPLTVHAANLLAKAFGQVRQPDAAADMMISRGWRGFDPSWLDKGRGGQPQGKPSFAEIAHRFNDEIQGGLLDRDS